jgi:hypothetical protein
MTFKNLGRNIIIIITKLILNIVPANIQKIHSAIFSRVLQFHGRCCGQEIHDDGRR